MSLQSDNEQRWHTWQNVNLTLLMRTRLQKEKEVINHDTVGSHRSNVSERHEIKHYVWVIWQKITNMTHLIAISIHNVHFLSQFWNTFEFLLLHIYISESYFMAKAPHQPCCIIYNRSTWGKALWIICSIAIWLATALCWSVPKAKICRSVT